MRNPTKFGSLNLYISSSRYKFLKLVFKSMKINKKFKATLRLTDGARGQRDPPVSEPEQWRCLTGDSSPTVRSPVTRLPRSCSSRQLASDEVGRQTSNGGWLWRWR